MSGDEAGLVGNEPVQTDAGEPARDTAGASRFAVDLEEHKEDLEQSIERVRELREDVLDRASAEDEERDAVTVSTSQEYERVERTYRKLQKSRDRVGSLVEEYGGSEWELRELMTGAIQHARDEARQEHPEGQVAEGHLKLLLLEKAITGSPPGAPGDVREYPRTVSQFLFDKVDAINTGGDTDLGLVPLEQAMEE